MIVLKQVIHYQDTNSVEATWVDQTTTPDTLDADGNPVPGVVTEVQVKCHSYADVQMDMLTADLGADLPSYLDLIALVEANIIPPAPAPAVVINKVTMRQARLALLQAGLLSQVNAALDATTGVEGEAARISWEFSNEVHRADPLITQLSTALSLTDVQVDDLFTLAFTL